jgi:hypothetical protein
MNLLPKITAIIALVALVGAASVGVGPAGDGASAASDPFLDVNPANNSVTGIDWPLGEEVTLTIDVPGTGEPVDYSDTGTPGTAPWDPESTWVTFGVVGLLLEPGHIVTMTDGVTTEEHIVTSLTITEVDQAANTVSGTAEAGSEVVVRVFEPEFAELVEVANGGTWTADFTEDVDIGPDAWGNAAQRDVAGNGTVVDWRGEYAPIFDVRPVQNDLWGWDWQLGREITLTVEDPVSGIKHEHTQTFEPLFWHDPSGSWILQIEPEFKLQAGQLVTMTDGVATKEHTVTDLTVTTVDVNADTVSGTATPGSEVEVGGTSQDAWASRLVVAGADGRWTADFSVQGAEDFEQDTLDLVPGAHGWTIQRDEDGDGTAVDWPPVTRLWGDVDGTGSVAIGDALKIARSLIELPVSYEPGTPEIGDTVDVDGADRVWGDVDGNGTVAIGDALKVARSLIGLSVSYEPDTPEIGSQIYLFYP